MPPTDRDRWHHRHDALRTYDVDLRILGAHIGRRATAVRGEDGDWTLIGPVPLDDAAARELAGAGGAVRRLVVQTAMHNTFVPEAHDAWPEATLWLARGAKRDRLDAARVRPLAEWTAEGTGLAAFPLDGMPRVNEVALHHAASRSLILADWMMHFPEALRSTLPLWTRLFLRASGWVPGPRVSRLYRAMIRDRAAFARSVEPLLRLEIERILPAHGVPVEDDAAAVLESLRRQSVGERGAR